MFFPFRGCRRTENRMSAGSVFNLIFNCFSNMALPDNIVKRFRPPFSVQCLIFHALHPSHRNFPIIPKISLRKGLLCRTPRNRRRPIRGNHAVSSSQASSRHTPMTAYRCSVPRLTRFTGRYCARPGCQHHLHAPAVQIKRLNRGIHPRYSGLRIQGTATSPVSTAFTVYHE